MVLAVIVLLTIREAEFGNVSCESTVRARSSKVRILLAQRSGGVANVVDETLSVLVAVVPMKVDGVELAAVALAEELVEVVDAFVSALAVGDGGSDDLDVTSCVRGYIGTKVSDTGVNVQVSLARVVRLVEGEDGLGVQGLDSLSEEAGPVRSRIFAGGNVLELGRVEALGVSLPVPAPWCVAFEGSSQAGVIISDTTLGAGSAGRLGSR